MLMIEFNDGFFGHDTAIAAQATAPRKEIRRLSDAAFGLNRSRVSTFNYFQFQLILITVLSSRKWRIERNNQSFIEQNKPLNDLNFNLLQNSVGINFTFVIVLFWSNIRLMRIIALLILKGFWGDSAEYVDVIDPALAWYPPSVKSWLSVSVRC